YLRAQSLQIVRALRRPKMAHRQSAQAVVLGGIQVDKLIRGTGGRRAPPGLRAVSQIGREARVVEERHDLAVGADHVGPRLLGAIFLPADRGLPQLGPKRIGVRAIGVVVDLSENGRVLGHGVVSLIPSWACWFSRGAM